MLRMTYILAVFHCRNRLLQYKYIIRLQNYTNKMKSEDVGMARVYIVHIQGANDNTAPLTHNHPYMSSCKLQLAKIAQLQLLM